MHRHHFEVHYSSRMGWLRAAVLGANDGIVSTASLVVGVAAAGATPGAILVAGVAGLVAGAMSMAAGEYVSVSSQADAERADIDRERRELEADAHSETRELAHIYVKRGLTPKLAHEVAEQFMAHDALRAHVRDELGLTEVSRPRPVQAAMASAATFAVGGALPLLAALASPPDRTIEVVAGSSLAALAAMGALAARAGGANKWLGAARVAFWGSLAMAATAAIGSLVGGIVS